MRKVLVVASGIGLVAALASTAPAIANSSPGAQTYHYTGCDDFGGVVVCYDQHGEFNVTTTPSGNTNFQSNGKNDYSVTFPDGYGYSDSSSAHVKTLWKKGELHVVSEHFSDTYKAPEGTCTYSYDYHYANGSVQFDNQQFNCS